MKMWKEGVLEKLKWRIQFEIWNFIHMNEIRSRELPLPKKVNTELRLNGREGLIGLKAHAILEVLLLFFQEVQVMSAITRA